MSNHKKRFINPYVLLLAKRMIDYEFVALDSELGDSALRSFIYDRYKDEKHKHTTFLSKDSDSFARGKARTFYQHNLLPLYQFNFTPKKLDEFVREITVLNKFTSWNQFESTFSRDAYYRIAQSKLDAAIRKMNRSLQKEVSFSDFDLQLFRQHANIKLFELHMEYVLLDKPHLRRWLVLNSDFIIRSANEREISELIEIDRNKKTEFSDFISDYHRGNTYYHDEFLEFLSTKSRTDFFDFPISLKEFHREDQHIFFVQRDKHNELIAGIILVPVKESFFIALKDGKRSQQSMTNDDVDYTNSFRSTAYIYFEYSVCNDAILEAIFYIYWGHTSIDTWGRNLVFGAKAYSSEERNNLMQFGFSESYQGKNHYNSKTYSFWEFHFYNG